MQVGGLGEFDAAGLVGQSILLVSTDNMSAVTRDGLVYAPVPDGSVKCAKPLDRTGKVASDEMFSERRLFEWAGVQPTEEFIDGYRTTSGNKSLDFERGQWYVEFVPPKGGSIRVYRGQSPEGVDISRYPAGPVRNSVLDFLRKLPF